MTKDEALLIFEDCQDDLYDCYQEMLFEFKQWFFTRPVISKVFKAKLRKLERITQAYNIITEKNDQIQVDYQQPDFSEVMLDSFNTFYAQKNIIKRQISQSDDGGQLAFWVQSLLMLHLAFADYVCNKSALEPIEVMVSNEPDPVEVIRELKRMQETGVQRFNELVNARDSEFVVQEINRLNLWRQY